MAQLIHGTTINGHIAIHAGNLADHSLATTTYVTTQINNLIAGAPGALNTLDELAAALGDDASFATSVTNSLAGKLSLTGGTLTGKVLFPSSVANRPQVPGGILGLDTGDGNFDIWGISRDYYPSHATAANAWGLRWNGDNNDFEFVGGGSNRVILDMDGGNLTASGVIYASGGNSGNWNTAYGWGNHASVGYLTALPSHNHDDRYYTESESDSRFVNTSGDTMSGRLTLSSISGVLQTVPNDFGAYLHLGDWGVGRTATGAVLVNTAYRADYATDLFDMNSSRFTNNSAYITTNGRAYPRNASGGDINFYWSGQSGQPTWLWGGTDGTNMYVYNPSNFSVNYANSAGALSSMNISQFTNNSGYLTGITSSQVTTALGYTPANSSHNHDGVYVRSYTTSAGNIDSDWGQSFRTFDPVPSGTPPISSPNLRTINIGENFSRRTQLAFNYATDQAWFRRNQDGTWYSWREFFHTGNFTDSSSNWNTAYNKRPTAIAFSGTGTKTLTLTQGDGSTLTASFSDIDTDTNTDAQTLSLSGNTLSISGGNSVTLSSSGLSQATADSLYVAKAGGSTVAGITYFSGGESIQLYGIRGRFGGEAIHLYNKVDIGHPGGWGAGVGNTPTYGLSTYGGAYFAYNQGTVSIGALGTAKLHVIGNTSGQELFAVDGVNGRLFSVVDDLSDSLYSVNTIAGLPVLEVFANNIVTIGKFGTNAIYVGQDGRVGFGTTDFSYTTSDTAGTTGTPNANRVFVNGSVQLIGSNDGFVVGRSGASFFKDEEIAFGWGGGWFMQDGTYLRVRGNKMVYSGGSARFDDSLYLGGETYRLYSANSGIWTNGNLGAAGDLYLGTRSTWLSSYLNQAVLTSSSPTFNDIYADNWFRNNGSNEGLYNQVTTQHLSSQANGYWDMSSTTSVSAIRFYTGGHVNSLRGHVYANSSNEIGFLNSAGNWGLRMDNSYNVQIYGTVSATNFSGSHSGTSSGTNTGDQTNISGNSGTTSQRSFDYLYASSYLESGGAVYGTIFYDNNDRDYYADFNTTSNSAIRVRGGMLMGPNPSWGAYLQVGGNGNESAYASVVTTNGNLHLDAADGRGTYINHYSGGTIYFGTAGTWTITGDGSYYNGTSAVANSVAWGNVSSRPTALSQFSNDLGNYGGWITSSGSISGTAARATRANGNFYIDDNYGNTVVGVYASTRLQGVFAMGDSYKLSADGTSAGALYGMAWSHPNAGGVAANLNTHGLLVMENGTFLAAISGSIRARDDMRAPAIYDNGSRVAISRGEGRNYVDYSRYVYNNGAYSGSGWIEPSDLGVRYAASANYATTAGSASANGGTSTYATYLNPLSGDGNYKLAYTANGARTNAGEWGRAVMYYVPNGQTYGIRVDRADYADGAGSVAWSNVSGRPTSLSEFSNNLGNYGSWITSSGSISGSSGSTNAVNNTGWGNGNFTWYQTPSGLSPYTGSWASFLISNHGDGSNYYNQTIIMPFWGVPQYSRREGGNNRGPWTFWTEENLNPNSISGNLAVSGSITAGADVTAYSDIRLKTNIKTIENALDKTLALRGVSYNRNDSDDTRIKIGVIAQETLEVIPEVVNQDSSGMYSVSYGNMTALLIEAIKEQQAQIEDLKSEIKKLKGE